MSNRRSRQSSSASRISDDQMIDLVSKLRQFLPEIRERRRSDKVYYIFTHSLYLTSFIYICIKENNSLLTYKSNKRNQKVETFDS